MSFQEYFSINNEIHDSILNFIDHSYENDEELFHSLLLILDEKNVRTNRDDLRNLLSFLSNIYQNHHRGHFFFDRIKKILDHLKEDIIQNFSNDEIFNIVIDSHQILLFLFENQTITFDISIFNYFQKNDFSESFLFFFYKEIMSFFNENIKQADLLDMSDNLLFGNQVTFKARFNDLRGCENQSPGLKINNQYHHELGNYDEKRHIGENESFICLLIRNDSIDEFISFVNSTNVKLNRPIERSKYETNPFLASKTPISIINYAAFFGSIQIFKFLLKSNIRIDKDVWYYAIHGRNVELIHIIEDQGFNLSVFNDDEILSLLKEAIKCHHNEIASYILDNMTNQDSKYLDELLTYICCSTCNYSLIPDEINIIELFFFLCANAYDQGLVKYMLEKDEKLANSKGIIKSALKDALQNKKYDVAQILLAQPGIEIESKMFQNVNALTKFIIPESVTIIGDYAFDGCRELREVTFPSSLISIGKYAFRKCASLKSVTIPSVTSIGYSAFAECSSLVKVEILSSSLTTIQFFTFEKCSSLKEVIMPPSVVSIERGAFDKCTSIMYIEMPKSISSIGDCAFRSCTSLQEISIPSSVEVINANTFLNCSSLTQVSFIVPSCVNEIKSNAFNDCSSLIEISLPSTVSIISENAIPANIHIVRL